MPAESGVLDLIRRLYEAASDTSAWEDFLGLLTQLTGSPFAALVYHEHRRNEHFVNAQIGIPEEHQRLYQEHYGATDEWVRGVQSVAKSGVWVGTGQMLVSDAQFARSEFYNDHLRKMDDAFHLCAAQYCADGNSRGAVSLMRRRKTGPFGEAQLHLLRLLLPHLQSAMRLRQNFMALRGQNQVLETALDRVATPIIFVGAAGRVIGMNRAADALLKHRDGLISAHQMLRAANCRQSFQFEKLIRAAAQTGNGNGFHPGGVMEISRKPPRLPLVISVAPLRAQVPVRFAEQAAAVIFITDPELRVEPAREVLLRLYGLTPAEYELALLMAQGNTLQQAAQTRRTSIETARAQIKSIFRKTNTSSQSRLVRLLLLLPAARPASSVRNLAKDSHP